MCIRDRYGFELFDVDERFDEHKKMSNPLFQPAMNTYFNSADEFLGRTVEEYKNWLLNNTCLLYTSKYGGGSAGYD